LILSNKQNLHLGLPELNQMQKVMLKNK